MGRMKGVYGDRVYPSPSPQGGAELPLAAPSLQDIKAELQSRIRDLCRELAPGGHFSGGYYIARNPARDDRNPGSFWVREKPPVGAWRDEATGDAGDVVDLVTYCLRQKDRKETYAWALSWLGWSKGVDRRALENRRKIESERKRREDEEAARLLAESRRKAFGWWLSAEKQILGTPVENYLASRGVPLSELAHFPGALRFLREAKHTDKAGRLTVWPAMLAAMSDAKGAIVAVHRTFLAADGGGKAPVEYAKKIWPAGWQGSFIRLSPGATKLNPEEAGRKGVSGPLLVTEGIEDALSAALACPELRVFAAGTLGNMAHVPKLSCISELIVAADNDTHAQANAGLDRVLTALREAGHQVKVCRSFLGKDLNDLLRGDE